MRKTLFMAAAIFAALAWRQPAYASGPVSVYSLVDQVSFEPNAENQQRIRISGVFITALDQTGKYSAPQRGTLYLALPAHDPELARREWADLKSVAGTRQVIGIGSSWSGIVRVRQPGDSRPPDDYPMGNGLIRLNAEQPRAKELLEYKGR
jgi:hypothetical protein